MQVLLLDFRSVKLVQAVITGTDHISDQHWFAFLDPCTDFVIAACSSLLLDWFGMRSLTLATMVCSSRSTDQGGKSLHIRTTADWCGSLARSTWVSTVGTTNTLASNAKFDPHEALKNGLFEWHHCHYASWSETAECPEPLESAPVSGFQNSALCALIQDCTWSKLFGSNLNDGCMLMDLVPASNRHHFVSSAFIISQEVVGATELRYFCCASGLLTMLLEYACMLALAHIWLDCWVTSFYLLTKLKVKNAVLSWNSLSECFLAGCAYGSKFQKVAASKMRGCLCREAISNWGIASGKWMEAHCW